MDHDEQLSEIPHKNVVFYQHPNSSIVSIWTSFTSHIYHPFANHSTTPNHLQAHIHAWYIY